MSDMFFYAMALVEAVVLALAVTSSNRRTPEEAILGDGEPNRFAVLALVLGVAFLSLTVGYMIVP